MTFAYWCVLAAALMPVAWAGIAKAGGTGFDKARPREYLAALSGHRQRANWAQQNAWEAFAPFAAGVVIAAQTGAAQATVDTLAAIFIAARVLHGACYVADRSSLRSIAYLAGLGCTIGLFAAGA
jgi:uncharacterized MAPEG superfamily protein